MSLRTCKKKSLILKEKEQSAREKRTSELLTCEKEFSYAQKNTIAQMREVYAQQLKKLQKENSILISQLEEADDAVRTMQVHLHEQDEQQKYDNKKWELNCNEKISLKQKEFEAAESNYKSTVLNLEKKLNVANIEISYLKNYKKSRNDVMTQTQTAKFPSQRLIPLADHLAMIKSIKEEFYKEKFQIQEKFQEKFKKLSETKSKKERDKSTLDNRNFGGYKQCEGSMIIATLETQRSTKDKKKMQELIEYYLRCLDEKSKQCVRQQDLIQKLQVLKKRQEVKIQQLIKSAKFNSSSSRSLQFSSRSCNKQDILSVRKLVQKVVDEKSEVENFLLDLIQHVKSGSSLNPKEKELELTWEQKEDVLNLIFSNLKHENPNLEKLKSSLKDN